MKAGVCLSDALWRTSELGARLRWLEQQPEPKRAFSSVVDFLISALDEGARPALLFDTHSNDVRRDCEQFFRHFSPAKQSLLLRALEEGMRDADASDARVTLSLMVRAGQECPARKAHVFSVLLNRVQRPKAGVSPLWECISLFVDEYKEKAFLATFIEPSKVSVVFFFFVCFFHLFFFEKVYFHAIGNSVMEGDVEVHGANTYLALLSRATGVALSRNVLEDDEVKGVVDMLSVASFVPIYDAVYSQFGRTVRVDRSVLNGLRLPHANGSKFCFPESTLPHLVSNLDYAAARDRMCFQRYLDRFCRWFEADLFCKALFQHIVNAGLADVLPCPEGEDVRFYLWDFGNDDDDPSKAVFRTDRARKIFAELGVCIAEPDTPVEVAPGGSGIFSALLTFGKHFLS